MIIKDTITLEYAILYLLQKCSLNPNQIVLFSSIVLLLEVIETGIDESIQVLVRVFLSILLIQWESIFTIFARFKQFFYQ